MRAPKVASELTLQPTTFDERDPRYRACKCCHVKTTFHIAATVDVVTQMCGVGFMFVSDSMTTMIVSSDVVAGTLTLIVALLAALGFRTTNRYLLLPYMVSKIMLVSATIASIVLVTLGVETLIRTDNMSPRQRQSLYVSATLVLTMSLAFHVFILIVLSRAYTYLRDKHWFYRNQECADLGRPIMTYTVTGQPLPCPQGQYGSRDQCPPPPYAELSMAAPANVVP